VVDNVWCFCLASVGTHTHAQSTYTNAPSYPHILTHTGPHTHTNTHRNWGVLVLKVSTAVKRHHDQCKSSKGKHGLLTGSEVLFITIIVETWHRAGRLGDGEPRVLHPCLEGIYKETMSWRGQILSIRSPQRPPHNDAHPPRRPHLLVVALSMGQAYSNNHTRQA
jgi:hypothetical protein